MIAAAGAKKKAWAGTENQGRENYSKKKVSSDPSQSLKIPHRTYRRKMKVKHESTG